MNKKVLLRYFAVLLAIASPAFGMETPENTKSLFMAISVNNFKGVQEALNKGANVNATNHTDHITPLGYAINQYHKTYGETIEIVKLLLDHGADPNLYKIEQNNKDEGNLYYSIMPNIFAFWSARYPLFSLLCQYGADPKKGFLMKGSVVVISAYHAILDETKTAIQYKNKWKKSQVKDYLMIGLLGLNLLDKQNSRLDNAMQNSGFNNTIKDLILVGIEKYFDYLQELDQKIKKDLDKKEEKYLKSCIQYGKQDVFKIIQNAQINGTYSRKIGKRSQEEIENPFIYNGHTYSSFRKHLYPQLAKIQSTKDGKHEIN